MSHVFQSNCMKMRSESSNILINKIVGFVFTKIYDTVKHTTILLLQNENENKMKCRVLGHFFCTMKAELSQGQPGPMRRNFL